MVVCPRLCFMRGKLQDEDFEKILYVARVIYYLNGLDDRYNIFAWPVNEIKIILHDHFFNTLYKQDINDINIDKVNKVVNTLQIGKNFSKSFYYVYKWMCFAIKSSVESPSGYIEYDYRLYKFYPVYLINTIMQYESMKRVFNYIMVNHFDVFAKFIKILMRISS